MRQAGVLAACGLLSLDVMYERLAEDHDRLNYMTTKMLTSNECKPWLSHKATEEKTMTTNLGFYQVKNGRADELVERLRTDHNILVSAKNNDVIRISTIKNGKRQEPTLLNKNINSGKWTAHPFIAPDESYLIFDSERENGVGKSDLYIRSHIVN